MVKKTVYIAPSMVVVNLGASDGLLTDLSANGVLGSGGYTKDNVTDADVKSDRGGFFDDEW